MKRITSILTILALVGLFTFMMQGTSAFAQNTGTDRTKTGTYGDRDRDDINKTDQPIMKDQFNQLADNNKMIEKNIGKLRGYANKMKGEKDQVKLQTELQNYRDLWVTVQQQLNENQRLFDQTFTSVTGQPSGIYDHGTTYDHGMMDHNGTYNHDGKGMEEKNETPQQEKNENQKGIDTTKVNNPSGY